MLSCTLTSGPLLFSLRSPLDKVFYVLLTGMNTVSYNTQSHTEHLV